MHKAQFPRAKLKKVLKLTLVCVCIQDSQNGDLCQQMSMVTVTPQTSLDGAGSGDGVMVMSQQPAGYTHSHQQMAVPAQQVIRGVQLKLGPTVCLFVLICYCLSFYAP